MSRQTYEFCTERARECAAEAEAATLDNVRERALRSHKTWLGLAEKARTVVSERARIESVKAAERAVPLDQVPRVSP